MPIQIHFEFTYRDYADAQNLHAKRSQWTYVGHFLAYYFYPFVGLLILLFEFIIPSRHDGSSNTKIILTVCGLVLLALPFYRQFNLRRCYRRSRTKSEQCTVEFGEEMIHVKGEHSKSEIQWSAIQSFSEGEKGFLLYLAQVRFVPVPKRVCSDAEVDDLRALFASKIELQIPRL
jgi:hypothetical protein